MLLSHRLHLRGVCWHIDNVSVLNYIDVDINPLILREPRAVLNGGHAIILAHLLLNVLDNPGCVISLLLVLMLFTDTFPEIVKILWRWIR